MRRMTSIGAVAALALAGVCPGSAQAPVRPRLSVLAVDTNSSFNFLPPPPGGSLTNKTATVTVGKSMKIQRLPRADGVGVREEVLQTVGGKPGEKEADKELRPNGARASADAAEREKIMSTVTTPLLPMDLPSEDDKKPKDDKELWINVKPKDDNPNAPQMPFDTWVLHPRDASAAPPTEPEPTRERAASSAQPAAKFDFTPSPFDLAPASKTPPSAAPSSRGLLSTRPMDLPLFGGNRDPGSPGFSAPRNVAPPEPVAPPVVKLPTVTPANPFPSVEISRDSPFANRPSPTASPFGGGASPSSTPFPAPTAAGMRPAVAMPFPTEASRLPPKTREEQAAEKWEKHFEDRKRGF